MRRSCGSWEKAVHWLSVLSHQPHRFPCHSRLVSSKACGPSCFEFSGIPFHSLIYIFLLPSVRFLHLRCRYSQEFICKVTTTYIEISVSTCRRIWRYTIVLIVLHHPPKLTSPQWCTWFRKISLLLLPLYLMFSKGHSDCSKLIKQRFKRGCIWKFSLVKHHSAHLIQPHSP